MVGSRIIIGSKIVSIVYGIPLIFMNIDFRVHRIVEQVRILRVASVFDFYCRDNRTVGIAKIVEIIVVRTPLIRNSNMSRTGSSGSCRFHIIEVIVVISRITATLIVDSNSVVLINRYTVEVIVIGATTIGY